MSLTPMERQAVERVQSFLNARSAMKGLDRLVIGIADGHELLSLDLLVLINTALFQTEDESNE